MNKNKHSIKHPIQPLELDKDDVVRFKQNAIVRWLLDVSYFDMNHIAVTPFEQEDREQFAQLIGYSLRGFGDLSYVKDETYERAEKMWEDRTKEENE